MITYCIIERQDCIFDVYASDEIFLTNEIRKTWESYKCVKRQILILPDKYKQSRQLVFLNSDKVSIGLAFEGNPSKRLKKFVKSLEKSCNTIADKIKLLKEVESKVVK